MGDEFQPGDWILVGGRIGQDFKGQIVQAIAGQHGGGFIEGLVHGGLPAAQVIIVHARQIVVDQAVDMDAFDRERDPERLFAWHMEDIAGRNHQQRAHAFATADRRMAHGFIQPSAAVIGHGQQPIETLIDGLADGIKGGLQAERGLHHVRSPLLRVKRAGGDGFAGGILLDLFDPHACIVQPGFAQRFQ